MWGSIISGGLGLLGAVSKNKQSKDNNKQTDAQILRNRDWELADKANYFTGIKSAARAAGLNFQTALGASSGYGSQARGFSVSNPQQKASVFDGLKTSVDVFNEKKQRQDEQAEQHKRNLDLINAESDVLRRAASLSDQPVVDTTVRGVPGSAAPADNSRIRVVPPAVMIDDAGQEMMGNMTMLGQRVEPNKNTSDAAIIEERYGDVAGSLYGLGVLSADISKNVRKTLDEGKERQKKLTFNNRVSRPVNKAPRAYYGPPGSRTGF